MLDSGKKQKLLSLLDSLDEHLDGQDGEAMKSPMDDEESPAHEAAEGEPTPAALVVEVGAPKDGPPKPPAPGGESSSGDAMAVIQAALKSNDPAVKAAAEAFMKSKGG